jgi:hypothetical protein
MSAGTPGESALPAHLQAFMYACIDSKEHLELLLLLRSTGDALTARDAAREVGLTDGRARALLDTLAARGLARVDVRDGELAYAFRPASAALASYCTELSIEVAKARGVVMQFVAGLPPPAVRAFAHAFRIRKVE